MKTTIEIKLSREAIQELHSLSDDQGKLFLHEFYGIDPLRVGEVHIVSEHTRAPRMIIEINPNNHHSAIDC
jgi:hypothetical protein